MFDTREIGIRVGLMMFSSTEIPILKRDLIARVVEYHENIDYSEVSQELRRLIERGDYAIVGESYIIRCVKEHSASDRIMFLNN